MGRATAAKRFAAGKPKLEAHVREKHANRWNTLDFLAFYKQAYREAKAWAYVDKTWKVLRKAAINRLQRILSLKETNFNIVGEREQTFAKFMTERNLDIFGVGQRRQLAAYWQQLRSHLLIDP